MHLVYHALIVAVFRVEKLHGVPVVVVAPVLPVLHHAVEGHAKLAVFSHHVDDFLGALVALLALVKAEVPQWRQLCAAGHLPP